MRVAKNKDDIGGTAAINCPFEIREKIVENIFNKYSVRARWNLLDRVS